MHMYMNTCEFSIKKCYEYMNIFTWQATIHRVAKSQTRLK